MHDFKNKVFMVTGAGSGIGRALCQRLDSVGCKIIAVDKSDEKLDALSKELDQEPTCFPFSVDQAEEWQSVLLKITSEIGRLDGLINNAGIAHDANNVEDFDITAFRKVMDVNFYGLVYGTQACLPLLKNSPKGWLCNISSLFGLIGIGQLSAYCASKFAVKGFTDSLRMEAKYLYPNLTVSVVHPGGISTEIATNAIAAGDLDEATRDTQVHRFNKNLKTSPNKASKVILDGMHNQKHRILIGNDARFLDIYSRVRPEGYVSTIYKEMRRQKLITDVKNKHIK